ncbi:MAG: pyridoxal phosphate-dependent aminotransferase [Nostoc sp. DedQUE04]|uniref:pyridoxal phosphate-dependent aminotransferase n=1 Tax=Nostoc sp. DedQUE04 TaxID=3075390 RepID=UPI002AD4DBE9|nr:pyridoxal phosphate-dependent aminotransferase [Nostoc sp. DedQUE04]MDZ8140389.1 pyridoxal phosphate-dependent aminotransferase [Nostoc sp. DedQUE04]
MIDLSLADPQDGAPQRFKDELRANLENPRFDFYPNKIGEPELQEAIAIHYSQEYKVSLDFDTNICITAGGWQALTVCLQAMGQAGDVVAYIEPVFHGIPKIIKVVGMKPYPLPMKAILGSDADLEKTFQFLSGAIFLLNSPHNPTGTIVSPKQLRAIAQAAQTYNVKVVSDFVFKDIYEDQQPRSYLEYDSTALEVCSFSKTFRMSGWRCGYIIGRGLYIKRVLQLRKNLDSGVPSAIQLAIVPLVYEKTEVAEFRCRIANRRKFFVNGLKELGFRVSLPTDGIGTNLVWTALSSRMSSSQEAVQLLDSVGVKALPGLACGALGEGHLRFSLNVNQTLLQKALERIAHVFS